MGAMASQFASLTIVYSTVYSAQIKENIKALRHWPLCGEFTGEPSPVLSRLSGHADPILFFNPFDVTLWYSGGPRTTNLFRFHRILKVILELASSAHCTYIWKLNRISITNISKFAWKCIWCCHRFQRCVTVPTVGLGGGEDCAVMLNTLRPRQDGRYFADDTFKCIFCEENVRISIKISLNFVPKSPNGNIPALFQIMAWRRPGDNPLSEAMMVSLLTHIYASLGLNELKVWSK